MGQKQGHCAAGPGEASYRQALEIFLELEDRHAAARNYGHLGALAHQQLRFDEAEASYRQALEIFLRSDQQLAFETAMQLGNVLADVGQHAGSARTLLDAAVSWYQLNGTWDPESMKLLKRERQFTGEKAFNLMVTEQVPMVIREELTLSINNAEK